MSRDMSHYQLNPKCIRKSEWILQRIEPSPSRKYRWRAEFINHDFSKRTLMDFGRRVITKEEAEFMDSDAKESMYGEFLTEDVLSLLLCSDLDKGMGMSGSGAEWLTRR
jgi:hypothetical protein